MNNFEDILAKTGRELVAQIEFDQNLISDVDADGNTLLLKVVCDHKFNSSVVERLLEKGAKVDHRNNNGDTVLHLLCRTKSVFFEQIQNSYQKLETLLRFTDNVNSKNNKRLTPLMEAIKSQSYYFVKLLVENYADTNTKDEQSKPAIFYLYDTDLLKMFLDHSADTTVRFTGYRLLEYMIFNYPDSPNFLNHIETIAEYNRSENKELIFFTSINNLRCNNNDKIADMLIMLIERGYAVTDQIVHYTFTVSKKEALIQAVIKYADHSKKYNNSTILHWLIEYIRTNLFELTKLCLKCATNIRYYGDIDSTDQKSLPLMQLLHKSKNYVDVSNYNEIVRLLLDHTLNINHVTNQKWTLLHYLMRYSKNKEETNSLINHAMLLDMTQLLLGMGADISIKSDDDWTPLHLAIRYVDNESIIDILNMLLPYSNPILINSCTKLNWTPIRLALFARDDYQREMIAQMLIDNGVNLSFIYDDKKMIVEKWKLYCQEQKISGGNMRCILNPYKCKHTEKIDELLAKIAELEKKTDLLIKQEQRDQGKGQGKGQGKDQDGEWLYVRGRRGRKGRGN